jgi:Ca-activated chloride channel family protein
MKRILVVAALFLSSMMILKGATQTAPPSGQAVAGNAQVQQAEPEAAQAQQGAVPKMLPQQAHPQQNLSQNVGHGQGRKGSVTILPTDGIKPQPVSLDGRKGWKVTIPGNRAIATPAVVDGTVYVGGGFGSYEFYAFKARSGEPSWAIRVSDDGPTAAVVKDGYTAFNTESCTLFVVDSKTGKEVWSKWLGDPLMSQPAIAQGRVFMAYPGPGGHRLAAFDLKTGKDLWSAPIPGDVITAPIVSGDSVYVTTFDGTVYRYTVSEGKEIWKKTMSATSAPYIENEQIYISRKSADAKGAAAPKEGIANLYGKTGAQANAKLWSERDARYLDSRVQKASKYASEQSSSDSSVGFSQGPATAKLGQAAGNVGQGTVRGLWEYQGSRPMLAKGKLYSTFGDAINCTDPATEKAVWEHKLDGDLEKLGGHLATPPSLAGDKLYVGTATGYLAVYNSKDGSLVWKVKIGEPIRFQPAVMNGWVYVGTTQGNIYAFETQDASATGWSMWGGSAAHNGPEGEVARAGLK